MKILFPIKLLRYCSVNIYNYLNKNQKKNKNKNVCIPFIFIINFYKYYFMKYKKIDI